MGIPDLPISVAHSRDGLRYGAVHGVEAPVEGNPRRGGRGGRRRRRLPPLTAKLLLASPFRSPVREPHLGMEGSG